MRRTLKRQRLAWSGPRGRKLTRLHSHALSFVDFAIEDSCLDWSGALVESSGNSSISPFGPPFYVDALD
jgi:hypothetical protein